METQLIQIPRSPAPVELDLIADLACPWSYLGKRSLERALTSLYSAPTVLRWHGLPLAGASTLSWHEHLSTRLPRRTRIETTQDALQQAGHEFGIRFDFARLAKLPDTHDAHRLIALAARSGRQSELIDALFSAFFEQGQDIAEHAVLARVAEQCQLADETQRAFADPAAARDDILAEERRMRGLGIADVPSVLINGRVLVPGPADVATYVRALEQALFPELPEEPNRRQLH